MYYCNGGVVGVKTSEMNFYITLQDMGDMTWEEANKEYLFCGNLKSSLPSKNQLVTIYNNKSTLNNLLSTNGGKTLTEAAYWSATKSSITYRHYVVNMSTGYEGEYYDSGYNNVRHVF